MAFTKGQQKKGGRTKGTPDKITTDTRHVILLAIDEQSEQFNATMEQIRKSNPVDWAKIVVKMMDFVLPKKLDVTSGGKIINVVPPNKNSGVSPVEKVD